MDWVAILPSMSAQTSRRTVVKNIGAVNRAIYTVFNLWNCWNSTEESIMKYRGARQSWLYLPADYRKCRLHDWFQPVANGFFYRPHMQTFTPHSCTKNGGFRAMDRIRSRTEPSFIEEFFPRMASADVRSRSVDDSRQRGTNLLALTLRKAEANTEVIYKHTRRRLGLVRSTHDLASRRRETCSSRYEVS